MARPSHGKTSSVGRFIFDSGLFTNAIPNSEQLKLAAGISRAGDRKKEGRGCIKFWISWTFVFDVILYQLYSLGGNLIGVKIIAFLQGYDFLSLMFNIMEGNMRNFTLGNVA